MHTLKFSHDYEKLPLSWDGTQAILIGVQYISDMDRFKLRLPQLITIDTKFRGEEGSYELDFKEGILLAFFHLNSSRLFTTIRKFKESKYEYYHNEQQETFVLKRVDDTQTVGVAT